MSVDYRLSTNEASALLNAALNDAGITLQPTYPTNSHIKNEDLIRILPDWKPNFDTAQLQLNSV